MSQRLRLLLVAAAVAVVVAVVGTTVWLVRSPGEPTRLASPEGGFSVEVPDGWRVDFHRPDDPEHMEFMTGYESTLGLVHRAGFWVARWSVPETTRVRDIQRRMRVEDADTRRNPKVGTSVLAGRNAALVRFDEDAPRVGNAGLTTKRVTIRETVVDGFIYQVGTWSFAAPKPLRDALEHVAASFEVQPPQPWVAEIDNPDATVEMPGGWVEQPTDLPGAIFFAVAGGDPTPAWVYVFHYDDTPEATLAAARSKIPTNGGVIGEDRSVTFAGRDAQQLTYTFVDPGRPPAHAVEWIVGDERGGSLVLAVARRSGDSAIAEKIALSWRF